MSRNQMAADNWFIIDHLNFGLVWYSDVHCALVNAKYHFLMLLIFVDLQLFSIPITPLRWSLHPRIHGRGRSHCRTWSSHANCRSVQRLMRTVHYHSCFLVSGEKTWFLIELHNLNHAHKEHPVSNCPLELEVVIWVPEMTLWNRPFEHRKC